MLVALEQHPTSKMARHLTSILNRINPHSQKTAEATSDSQLATSAVDSRQLSAAETGRGKEILTVFNTAFGDLLAGDPDAFQTKFRKMAASPFAFVSLAGRMTQV